MPRDISQAALDEADDSADDDEFDDKKLEEARTNKGAIAQFNGPNKPKLAEALQRLFVNLQTSHSPFSFFLSFFNT